MVDTKIQITEPILETVQTDWWHRGRQRFILTTIERLRKRYERSDQYWEILDAGCGEGSLTAHLSSFGLSRGIDIQPEAVEFARRTYRNCQFDIGSIPSDLPEASFDLITLLDVLEHLDCRTETLQQIRDHLKPQGWVLLSVPAFPCLWTRRDESNHHRLRYRRRQLIQDLEAARFRVIFISFFNMLMFPPIWITSQIERFSGIRLERIVQRRDCMNEDQFIASRLLNRLLYPVFLVESLVAGRLALPIGVSLLAVAEKSDL